MPDNVIYTTRWTSLILGRRYYQVVCSSCGRVEQKGHNHSAQEHNDQAHEGRFTIIYL